MYVRQRAGKKPGASNNSGDNGGQKTDPVDEPRTLEPGNTMSEQLGDK